MKAKLTVAVASIGLLLAVRPLVAHHSFAAEFDAERPVQLRGVVTGMDWEHEAVFVNDPARGKLVRIERADFEKEWQAVGNWMLLAVPSQPAPAE